MRKKADFFIAMLFFALAMIACLSKLNDGLRMLDDSAAYINQAISLIEGTTKNFIDDNSLMIEKCDFLIGPNAYPWGYPMLLSIAYKIFGFHLYAFKSVGVICYCLFVAIFYVFCARRLRRIYAIFATIIFAISPTLSFFATNEIISDIPFLLFGFLAMITLANLFGVSKNRTDSYKMADSSKMADSRYFAEINFTESKADSCKLAESCKLTELKADSCISPPPNLH